ncbi:MAG TPA: Mov34/MPN/PAD-1 family protein [Steroidobacteraceae bacterium]|nr:Mov34/MPN/PAD-1 family protein [Steroidobacteraceae bacterium]
MQWRELSPRLPVQDQAGLIARHPDLQGLPSGPGTTIVLRPSLRQRVLAQLAASDVEQGGLLIGEVFEAVQDAAGPPTFTVLLKRCIPATHYAASAVSLQMGTEVWSRAREALETEEMIAGWYHSHPGLGAFFSRRDRQTQRDFFSHAWSVGWVVDPSDASEAWFVGAEASAPGRSITVPDC